MPDDRKLRIFREPEQVPYAEMLERQRAVRTAVEQGRAPHTLFLLEHPPTITLGRKSSEAHILRSREDLAAQGVTVETSDRGGDVTFHGPGQLVAYPILNLELLTPSVGWYLRRLEDVVIALLADYGLAGERKEGLTGVWVGDAKAAAIGIGVHRWVTFHGCAINVNPDMNHFGLIIPCGIPDKPVTSLRELLGTPPQFEEVRERFVRNFLAVFELEPEH